MARPLKPIDPEMVEKLAGAGCTAEQIGAILDCNERTIQFDDKPKPEPKKANGGTKKPVAEKRAVKKAAKA